jgi:hypothetical protein
MIHNFFLILYYIWKYFITRFSNQVFSKTVDIPLKNLFGNFYQIMQTPNSFQKTGIAMAKYTPSKNNLKLLNREFVESNNGNLIVSKTIQGQLEKIDHGTYFVYFDDKPRVPGIYRILHFEEHPKHGTFLFVSSYSPNLSWLLWKPPFDKSNLLKSYEYALTKKKLFTNIGVEDNQVKITNPTHIIEMIHWTHFVNT